MYYDPYAVLGINPGATDDEIKKAYRALSRKYHPDANLDNPKAAEEKFKEIQQAYSDLMEHRDRYTGAGASSSGYGAGGYNSSRNGSSGYGAGGYAGGNQYGNSDARNPYNDTFYGNRGGYGSGGYSNPYGGRTYRKAEENPFEYSGGFYGPFGGFANTTSTGNNGKYVRLRDEDTSETYRTICNLINVSDFNRALDLLNQINRKTHRWYYFAAVANYYAGYNMNASRYILLACELNPGDVEYESLRLRFGNVREEYDTRSMTYGRGRANDGVCGPILGFILFRLLCRI